MESFALLSDSPLHTAPLIRISSRAEPFFRIGWVQIPDNGSRPRALILREEERPRQKNFELSQAECAKGGRMPFQEDKKNYSTAAVVVWNEDEEFQLPWLNLSLEGFVVAEDEISRLKWENVRIER